MRSHVRVPMGGHATGRVVSIRRINFTWNIVVCWLLQAGACGAFPITAAEPNVGIDRSQLLLELTFENGLADSSPAGNTVVAHGEIVWNAGRRGTSALFDGRCWIDTGIAQDKLGDQFTVECWVRPSDHQSQDADIFGNHVGDGQGLVLQQDGSNTNQFLAAYGVGGRQWVLTESVPLAAERWQHVALVKTRDELRFFLNGVLVAVSQDARRPLPSPMAVAVGLGYTDEQRCFRGRIDDFRLWSRPLDSFSHAGIDPVASQETRAQFLLNAARPAVDRVTRSWTVATEDTQVTLGVTAAGELVVQRIASPTANWNWIVRPVAATFPTRVVVADRSRELQWRFQDATVDQRDGQQARLRFVSADPALEIVSQWQACPGPGPVHHRMQIRNRASQPVTLGEQPTFDLDVTGASTLWCFHSDGGTPDPVGVYQHDLAEKPQPSRHIVRTSPAGEFLPYVVLDAAQRHGLYLGLEWSCCRLTVVPLADGAQPSWRVRWGNTADMVVELAAGEALEVRPGFIGTYSGDVDDAGNRLRRWLWQYRVPEILRRDRRYPKVQWNAFGATGKAPGSWDPVEAKYYPLIDDIAPLGFEEVMIDVGWWSGSEPDPDPVDWPSGMKRAADYAHERGMRFGLYWTDDLDMNSPAGRRQRAARVRRLFEEHGADMWRSDNTRGPLLEASYEATRGFYALLDSLAEEIPGFQWENCCSGGRVKDYGAMRRAVKIFNSDTYSTLHVRQAFYDSSFALHPAQLEGHLGSTDGQFRPRGAASIRYAFRSMSMGAPEWFLDAPNGGNDTAAWTEAEKETLRACVETYKMRIRPLVREADLYHILPRPTGRQWDGIEYYDPAAGKGVLYLFNPATESATETIRLRGLATDRSYRLVSEDGSQPERVCPGSELLEHGLQVTLEGPETSELIFLDMVR